MVWALSSERVRRGIQGRLGIRADWGSWAGWGSGGTLGSPPQLRGTPGYRLAFERLKEPGTEGDYLEFGLFRV